MKPPAFEYAAPSTIDEAVKLLASSAGNAKVISGGQSLMPMLAFRLAAPDLLVDLKRLSGLNQIAIGSDGVRLGAKVRWCDIEADERLRQHHPLLAKAIEHVAHYQVRNRGTVGGSLAHADPAADLPAVAVALDASFVIAGADGRRTVPAAEFFEGVFSTAIGEDELLVEVRVPEGQEC